MSDHPRSVTDAVAPGVGFSSSREYDPWGNLIDGDVGSGYAFTGREWDAETGLYYYRARYYDPKIGRFISEDPLPLVERPVSQVNAYAYVRNSPISLVDPTGLCGTVWKSSSYELRGVESVQVQPEIF